MQNDPNSSSTKKFVVLVSLAAVALAIAAPASASIETGAIERPTNAAGVPTGPWRDLPPQAAVPNRQERSLQAASGCKDVGVYRKSTSPLGIYLWTFYHYAHFCWSMPNVTGINRWTDAKVGSFGGWQYDGIVASSTPLFYTWCCSAGHSGHQRMFKGKFHVEGPVIGTWQTAMPYIWLYAHGDGSIAYTTGQ